jgi:DNA end-binding protein Ku
MTARAIGSGTISFGLVSIPFKVYTAASSQNLSFNLLHKKCGGRMKQQYLCPLDNAVVDRADMVKGFEFAKDQYVQFTEEELKKLESTKIDSLEITEFVPEETVDPIHVEKSFYIGPDKGGEKAFQLLAAAMVGAGRIAVGRYWTRGRQQVVFIRPYKNGLILQYIFYAGEVRSYEEVAPAGKPVFKDVELELAHKLVSQLSSAEFDARKYRDEYQDRVRAAVDQKVAGLEVTFASEAPKAIITDLFEALKRSLVS